MISIAKKEFSSQKKKKKMFKKLSSENDNICSESEYLTSDTSINRNSFTMVKEWED